MIYWTHVLYAELNIHLGQILNLIIAPSQTTLNAKNV